MNQYKWNLKKIYSNKKFIGELENLKGNINSKLIGDKNIINLYKRKIIKMYNYCLLNEFTKKNSKDYCYYKKELNNLYNHLIYNPNMKSRRSSKEKFNNLREKINNRKVIYCNNEINYNDITFSKYMNNSDRNLRRKIFYDYYLNIKDNRVKLHKTLINYLKENNIKHEHNCYVYIEDAINKSVKKINEYYLIKSRLLNVDKLHYYDVYKNLDDKKVSYNNAKTIIKNTLNYYIQNNEYNNISNYIFKNNLIDVYPSKEKIYGYFTIKCYDIEPHIFLNYINEYKDLFLLSHELGHSIAYILRKENNSYEFMQYFDDMEIPAIINELLVAYYLISNNKNNDKSLICILIDMLINNFYRYGIYGIFEKFIVNNLDKKLKDLETEFLITLKKYYPHLTIDEIQKYEFLKIPHYYNKDFYCFKYSFAVCIALNIVKKIIDNRNYINIYIDFIKNATAFDKNNIKKYFDIDINDENTYLIIFDEIQNLINKLEE